MGSRDSKVSSTVDLTAIDHSMNLPIAQVPIAVAGAHLVGQLVDGFAVFGAVADEGGKVIELRTEYANTGARRFLAASTHLDLGVALTASPVDGESEHVFDQLLAVAQTGKPMIRELIEYRRSGEGDAELVSLVEIRVVGVNDSITIEWRDGTVAAVATVELERINRELVLLGELIEYLQSVRSVAEIFDVAENFGPRLFEGFSGALSLVNQSGTIAEQKASFGDEDLGEVSFSPGACWALRRGQRHGGIVDSDSLRCEHLPDGAGPRLCIPLVAQGQVTGLLVLAASTRRTEERTAVSGSYQATEALAISVGEHIQLALTTLRLRKSLLDQSIMDPLTGLFNRRYLEETLEREVSRSIRSGKPFSLMMLDLDQFKEYNDAHGHAAGDRLLEDYGALLVAHIRGEDVACRYGGDEFVILFPESPIDGALLRAEEIRSSTGLFQHGPYGPATDPITFTIGVACYPDHGADKDELIAAADEAMYRAKRAGGNRVEVAVPDSDRFPQSSKTPKR